MGMNYYWHASGKLRCECCGQKTASLHIGKASTSWAFMLHIHPYVEDGEPVNDLWAWLHLWKNGAIFNEEGDIVSRDEMLAEIMLRGDPAKLRHQTFREEYPSVKPGGPTYDLCNYEFC